MTQLLTIGGPAVPAETGVTKKPDMCRRMCCYYSVGAGWAEDVLPPAAKIMVLVSSPSSDDILNRKLLSGKAGWSFFKTYIFPLGHKQEDVAISAVMRCRPKAGKFPLGRDKKSLVESCRYYDQGAIKSFNPDMYVIAHDIKLAYSEPVYSRLIQSDIARAFDFAAKGFRPIVLLGTEASELVAPFIVGNGGTKTFHSHYDWFAGGTWPFLHATPQEPKPAPGFAPARF